MSQLAVFEERFLAAQERVARKTNGHSQRKADANDADEGHASPGPGVVNGATAALVSRCAAEIAPEKIEWLWPGRLARGKHTCIAGEPGTGKSQLSIIIVSTLTTGGEWPCGEGRAPPGNVIILSAGDTIVP